MVAKTTGTNDAGPGKAFGGIHYLGSAPIFLFASLIVILRLHSPTQACYEHGWLIAAVNLVVFVGGSLVAAALAARAYRAGGSPLALALGCGMLTLGLACLAGAVLVGPLGNVNAGVTTHNLGTLLASAIWFAGVASTALQRSPDAGGRPLRTRGLRMAAGHALVSIAMAAITATAVAGLWPEFWTRHGTSALRLVVLSTTIAMLASASLLLIVLARWVRDPFLDWCAWGLGLLAIGVLGVTMETSPGSPLSWTGRAAQAVGQIYVVVGLLSLVRRRGAGGSALAEAFGDLELALRESRTRYKLLFDAMAEGFALHEVICDATGAPSDYRFLDVNPAFERLTGLRRKDVVGKTFDEVLPGEDPAWISTFGEVARTGRPARLEGYSQVLDRHFSVLAYSPAPRRFAVVFSDITERKRAEEELRQQTDLLTVVAANTRAHLVYLDRDFNFIWVNQAYADACAKTPEEFIGHNHFEFYPHEENQAIFESVRDTGVPFEVKEKPFVFPDHPEWGVTYWDWTLTPIKDSEGVVQSLVFSLLDVTRDMRARQEFEARQRGIYEREHRIAEALQGALVPSQIPTSVGWCRFAARYLPALQEANVGGDFYDVFHLMEGRVGVLIGDVAGKGLAAAIRVSAARYAIRSYAYMDPRPSRVMTLANDALAREQPEGEMNMLTAFFAVVDTTLGTITYANAGHEEPVLIRGQEHRRTERLTIGGRALGITENSGYAEASLRLEPGDAVVMVTDGITEAKNENGNLFGSERMAKILRACPGRTAEELADCVVQAASSHAGGKLHDDVAVVVIAVEGPEAVPGD